MSNTFFQFKKFIVHQDKTAMKVGTDGVLLGAWADVANSQTILDIGTGTGLIALMLAQRNIGAKIKSIDIEDAAVDQAKQNFLESEWSQRLSVSHSSLQDFVLHEESKFDHIVCNPPYFNNSLKSTNDARSMARHTDSLSYRELLQNSFNLLNGSGRFSLVLPFSSEKEFTALAIEIGFHVSRINRIKPTPTKGFVRCLIELSKQATDTVLIEEMIIEDKGRHCYSDRYIELTKDFYLKM
ncbi:tRNA1(Val) (adenine(37)-N6)-methyltransferase [Carboxylicivirga sp. M1479]|uniref:tRNA1(Val) (adenine(37)-N6)-methyltransferase n=1 Tax=Carboxylicivirga sp. M1479 TaxID=2594476 RepID=UPI00117873EC|nr:methyltransferase [Carboxylicivirga sp. M1479]TRX65795.1 methyltransferase [Carboxylicivirga sp. M1479]